MSIRVVCWWSLLLRAFAFSGPHHLRLSPGKPPLSTKTSASLFQSKITPNDNDRETDKSALTNRRAWLVGLALLAASSSTANTAHAFDNKAYPVELTITDASDRDPRREKVQTILDTTNQQDRPSTLASCVLWASALWFLTGSRSTPIATPLANILYDDNQEWLQDRNDGLFAKLPWEFLLILGAVFLCLGFGVDSLVNLVADGNLDASIQLGGVSLIGGCALELGRIASGEKKQTRVENDRSEQLWKEFTVFAQDRLTSGGNCHRAEVVQAFRRYYAKYRQVESTEFPLSDLEIEELLRSYCRSYGIKMSPSGFYNNIQINQEADVFVQR